MGLPNILDPVSDVVEDVYMPELDKFKVIGIDGDKGSWETCRERITNRLKDYNQIYYCFKFDNKEIGEFKVGMENMAQFFHDIESKMEWDEKTTFQKLKKQNCLKIKIGARWKRDFMSVSLFTLLLRCAKFHQKGADPKECLAKYKYSKETTNAILRFFNGYQDYVGKGNSFGSSSPGWYDRFKKMSKEDIAKNLISDDVIKLRYEFIKLAKEFPQNKYEEGLVNLDDEGLYELAKIHSQQIPEWTIDDEPELKKVYLQRKEEAQQSQSA